MLETDFLIIGAGIVGLSMARELSIRFPDARILVLEKENGVALHASGRNSGVLHAGFYYSEDSLKAKLTREGNQVLTEYCLENSIPINRCGKVVVAKNQDELETLHELKRRGDVNGVDVKIIDETELKELEPAARTYGLALYSPTTSSVDPKQVCRCIASRLNSRVKIVFNARPRAFTDSVLTTNSGKIRYRYLINAAGLYADKIAHRFGAGLRYTLMPFKGVYLKCRQNNLLHKHVYPVPHLKNPFLGVHFTKTVDGDVKIGPTAMPAFWRENYGIVDGFKLREFSETMYRQSVLFIRNSAFRSIAKEEVRKYSKKYLIRQAAELLNNGYGTISGAYLPAGIRAQLVDKKTAELVMDFKVEHKDNTTHILNAVSPAFTCAFSFAKYLSDQIQERYC